MLNDGGLWKMKVEHDEDGEGSRTEKEQGQISMVFLSMEDED